MSGHRLGVLHRVVIVLLSFAAILLVHDLGDGSRPGAHGEASPTLFAAPTLRVQLGRQRLEISVTTASAEHEVALLALIEEQFHDTSVHTRFYPGMLLQPEWENLSTGILHLVATTISATAIHDASGTRFHGVTDNLGEYESRLQLIRAEMGNDIEIVTNIIAVGPADRMRDLCARNFAEITDQATAARFIEFHESSADLSNAAEPLLDRLAEFAYDCRNHKIAILGYTDASGPAEWNRQVSAARAQAVATKLTQRGVDKNRLFVEGRGAQSPVADNRTAQGRARNRRIEFELR